MDLIQASWLGVVQGLTEFLPVSSSGHLVIFQHLFGLTEPALAFDISVHIGTLAAVIFYFRKDIWRIVAALVRLPEHLASGEGFGTLVSSDPALRTALLIVVGSVPTAALGLAFKEVAERLFSSVPLVGAALLVTAVLLWTTRQPKKEGADILQVSLATALVIGLVQGLAIVPGISRSGSTIAVGILMGLDRETAARFSFLLSIPAVAGAGLLGAGDLAGPEAIPLTVVAAGTLISALVGYGALRFLVYIVGRGNLHRFAPYCAAAGIAALAWG